ncbi:MAG: 30S ribosomal protein S10 [Thermodesulfovibrio sp.]|nr:30S ribosomal protein S10 [Thermodesulfovibrio sp.]
MTESTSTQKQIMRIKLESYDSALLDQALARIIDAVRRSGAIVSGPVLLPRKVRRYTVNRSVHVDKKSREQFEIRVHKRLIDIYDPTPETVEALMKLELAAGVDVEIKL